MLQPPRTIYMFVENIQKSQSWYQSILGYPPRYTDEKFAIFLIGDVDLCFHFADEKSPVTTGGSVAYWWVPDFEKSVADVIALGGKVYRGPIATENGRRICQIRDPFGNVFGLEGHS